MTQPAGTQCAPGERLSVEDVAEERFTLAEHICSSYFDFFPLPLIVLNAHRQIVFSNKSFLDVLGIAELGGFLAHRPGEAMGCVYADVEENGCGTSENCRECGALRAILESMAQKVQTTHDCQMLMKNSGGSSAKDLRVFVSPWEVEGNTYYVLTINDIGDEKRRKILERIFFHDLLNSAGGAKGLADILVDEVPEDAKEIVNLVRASLFGLVEEIQKQKQLLALENCEYVASPITLNALEVLGSVAAGYRAHPVALEKDILVDQASTAATVKADYALLNRVVVNMLVNALEATPQGGTVSLGVRTEGEEAVFWVHNDKVMSDRVRLQVFKRSFSTKGEGRGLGTYSIKLLTENFLGGQAGFTSAEPEGTTFWVKLKLSLPTTVS